MKLMKTTRDFIHDDNGAFTLKEMVEAIIALGVGIILAGILLPIAFQMFGGLPENLSRDAITGQPTLLATIWGYIPVIVVVMLMIGLIFAILGWFGGEENER